MTQPATRTVFADVVAVNQPLRYNRFGSTNPWGMIYALRRDVDGSAAGEAKLHADKRPRPLVLRVSEGDELEIQFQNLLKPFKPKPAAAEAEAEEEGEAEPKAEQITVPDPPNDPATRLASIAIVGLPPTAAADATKGLLGLQPGERATYRYKAEKAGVYFFSSAPSVAGGEGDGGTLTHGLFGIVIVEPAGARFYRSQVTAEQLACARGEAGPGCGTAKRDNAYVDYEASAADGTPILNMLQRRADQRYELVHSDLTAIVVDPKSAGSVGQPLGSEPRNSTSAWREFSVLFHDELKTIHADDFAILNEPGEGASEREKARHGQLAGIRDGFGINYGASGMGPILLANRIGKGPARSCVDCAYEEFFLQSWANGDPALLSEYRDDPSNVYHSYLGDRVKIHNVHAGPKETHVFHLHAHQWLSQTGAGSAGANYLDSQTIAPLQSFSYEIYYGGSGNRNLTPGDSIFHCHLYPHFAQGMWALWRSHDVLEDGTRRLPDGGDARCDVKNDAPCPDEGEGTSPITGNTNGGTPIPALVPLPGQALPPAPTYVEKKKPTDPLMPGYPFYIAGQKGRRAPQPPLDMKEDAGLPRHVTLSGERARTKSIEQALDTNDMTFDYEHLKLQILPQAGTELERAAMDFHGHTSGGHDSVLSTDLNLKARFLVNGIAAAAGSPFANPCPPPPNGAPHWVPGVPSIISGTRTYDVSAINLDLLVNQYEWHDKQGTINVLDSVVPEYENQRRAADPFFFRAHSGECIVFNHTNRTQDRTKADKFQVATPVDIIGQHIHLVKFDVTSSDGSANGFNYEDGTFAHEHIAKVIAAAHAKGGSVDWQGSEIPEAQQKLALKTHDGKPVYQTTTQRWWADPLLDANGGDRTITTVFTHDHFGPSTIQQHGFYSALLIEPPGSTWRRPDGQPLADSAGQAVGTQAIIDTPAAPGVPESLQGSRREFALAVADFGLLYDKGDKRAIAPPDAPEAISKDHHDPYMFNYKLEPMPLRIGSAKGKGGSFSQRRDDRGDFAHVFDSYTHRDRLASKVDLRHNHGPGDPSTEIFEAYEGEHVQFRLVQGAQEVQHVFTLHGQAWRRQPADIHSPLVASQAIGISEHFEFDLGRLSFVDKLLEQRGVADYLYHAGTVDALWNGAWGLMRSYPSPLTEDPAAHQGKPIRCRLASTLSPASAGASDPACDGHPAAISADDAQALTLTAAPAQDTVSEGRLFCVEAVREPITYNKAQRIEDPDGLHFVLRRQGTYKLAGPGSLKPSCPARMQDKLPAAVTELPVPSDTTAPLVLRARSGEELLVGLYNHTTRGLPQGSFLPVTTHNAVLPRIVSWEGGPDAPQDFLAASSTVSLHPQLVSYNVRTDDGTRVGRNTWPDAGESGPVAATSQAGSCDPDQGRCPAPASATWYAGQILYDDGKHGQPVGTRHVPYDTALGMVGGLSSFADPIKHPAQGLIGALVIEPRNATIDEIAHDGTSARICTLDNGTRSCFRELVLLYQDGLNLKQDNAEIPDCHVCDDTYDSGDVAFNYRTEPFWARLGLPREDSKRNEETGRKQLVDLNASVLPPDFLLPDSQPLATPVFKVTPGERVVIRAVHPGGRARQHTLAVYGHRYDDLGMPQFGSPSASLLAPQRATSADLGPIREGLWLFRDGPGYFVAGGAWGYIDARAAETARLSPSAPLRAAP